jgi:hypothetical protein
MQKGDKVRLVKSCPELDEIMGVSVGDIGVCIGDSDEDMINVKFGKQKYPFILCSRLEIVKDNLSTEGNEFNCREEYSLQLKEQLARQEEIIKNLKNEVMLLKQDVNKCVAKSNSLDEDIKNLQERLDYLEGRHI